MLQAVICTSTFAKQPRLQDRFCRINVSVAKVRYDARCCLCGPFPRYNHAQQIILLTTTITVEIRVNVSPLIMVEKQPSAIICGEETSLLIKIIDGRVEMKLKSIPAPSTILINVFGSQPLIPAECCFSIVFNSKEWFVVLLLSVAVV